MVEFHKLGLQNASGVSHMDLTALKVTKRLQKYKPNVYVNVSFITENTLGLSVYDTEKATETTALYNKEELEECTDIQDLLNYLESSLLEQVIKNQLQYVTQMFTRALGTPAQT